MHKTRFYTKIIHKNAKGIIWVISREAYKSAGLS